MVEETGLGRLMDSPKATKLELYSNQVFLKTHFHSTLVVFNQWCVFQLPEEFLKMQFI